MRLRPHLMMNRIKLFSQRQTIAGDRLEAGIVCAIIFPLPKRECCAAGNGYALS